MSRGSNPLSDFRLPEIERLQAVFGADPLDQDRADRVPRPQWLARHGNVRIDRRSKTHSPTRQIGRKLGDTGLVGIDDSFRHKTRPLRGRTVHFPIDVRWQRGKFSRVSAGTGMFPQQRSSQNPLEQFHRSCVARIDLQQPGCLSLEAKVAAEQPTQLQLFRQDRSEGVQRLQDRRRGGLPDQVAVPGVEQRGTGHTSRPLPGRSQQLCSVGMCQEQP